MPVPHMFPQNEMDFQLASYNFKLPPELIAQRPMEGRCGARMLVYRMQSEQLSHHRVSDLPQIIPPHHALVFNNSQVIPCRFLGQKSSGGRAEVFLLSFTPSPGPSGALAYPALINTSGKKQPGQEYFLGAEKELHARLIGPWEEYGPGIFAVEFLGDNIGRKLYELGQIPIPQYIRDGISDQKDLKDYQTVFAQNPGSVAAPTAGLHFTPELLQTLKEQGNPLAYISLHVGPGTFRPVKCADIREHSMHREFFTVDPSNQALLKKHQDKLIAVGTTSLRVLESSWESSTSTDIFLYPGKEIRSVRGLLTNFHLPQSSLFMLVCALLGRSKAQELYQVAIEEQYRFYSYGDCMLILRDE